MAIAKSSPSERAGARSTTSCPRAKGASKVTGARTRGCIHRCDRQFYRRPLPEQRSHQSLTRQTCPLNLGGTIMQQTRARQILQSLIQGIDHVTTEDSAKCCRAVRLGRPARRRRAKSEIRGRCRRHCEGLPFYAGPCAICAALRYGEI